VLEVLQFGPAGWGDELARGAGMTLLVALLSFALGNLIGLAGALAAISRIKPLAFLITAYINVMRGVPELLVIYLLLFTGGEVFLAIGRVLGAEGGGNADAFIAGVLSLGVIAGAYTTEVLRGALLAIPKGQHEAAVAFGMSRGTILRRVTVPQLIRFALPGLGNVWQVVLKDTALISVTSLAELMRVSHLGATDTHRPFLFYAVAIAVYLLLTAISGAAFSRAERRSRRGLRASSA
jgi:octopine/nopaline transport system permease protein